MKISFPKNLIAPFFILFAAFNIIPVGLLSYNNIDLFKIITIAILIWSLLKFRGWKNINILFQSLFILAIFFSYINMIVTREKIFDWTSYYSLYYLYFFVLMRSFKKIENIYLFLKFIVILSLIATFIHIFFYLNPTVLEGTLTEIRMGSLRNDVEGIRIFIPGTGFIAIALLYLITKILYKKRINIIDIILLCFFSISIFFIASIRTYLLGIFVVLSILIFMKKISLKAIAAVLFPPVLLMLIFSLFNEEVYNYIISRFDIFFKIGEFKPIDTFNLNVEYLGELNFGTVYWRILESAYVLQFFFNDLSSFLFGHLGILYDFLGVEKNAAPHISIVGIYFLFGIIGLITFLLFFINFTVLIIKNLRLSRRTNLDFLSIIFAIIWFSLFIFSFLGGIYYSEMVLLVTFTTASSIILNKKLKENERLAKD